MHSSATRAMDRVMTGRCGRRHGRGRNSGEHKVTERRNKKGPRGHCSPAAAAGTVTTATSASTPSQPPLQHSDVHPSRLLLRSLATDIRKEQWDGLSRLFFDHSSLIRHWAAIRGDGRVAFSGVWARCRPPVHTLLPLLLRAPSRVLRHESHSRVCTAAARAGRGVGRVRADQRSEEQWDRQRERGHLRRPAAAVLFLVCCSVRRLLTRCVRCLWL